MIATRSTIVENTHRFLEPLKDEGASGYLISAPRFRFGQLDIGETRYGWLSHATEQLDAIAELPQGWDSYGADTPDEETLWGAVSLLESLHDTRRVPQPYIYPTRSGGVQFEWERGTRYLEIELLSPVEARYFYSDPSARIETSGEIREGDSLHEVLRLIERVAGGSSR